MITYENEWGKYNELTVTEFKEELEKLEAKGYGDYVVLVGYDANSCYTTADEFKKAEINSEGIGEVFFDTDDTF